MSAQILDGKALAAEFRAQVAKELKGIRESNPTFQPQTEHFASMLYSSKASLMLYPNYAQCIVYLYSSSFALLYVGG